MKYKVVLPRGTGWNLWYDRDDKVVGPHWAQDQTKATLFATSSLAWKAVQAYYGSFDATFHNRHYFSIVPVHVTDAQQ